MSISTSRRTFLAGAGFITTTAAPFRALAYSLNADTMAPTSAPVHVGPGPSEPGPMLWIVERSMATVYIFPLGDATDRSWLTPKIEGAFRESRQIWFETPNPNPSGNDLPEPSRILDEFEHDDTHSLFDALGPPLSQRLLATAKKYGVTRQSLEHTRLWNSYYVLNQGYWDYRAKTGLGDVGESPDQVLAKMAWKANTQVLSEFPTNDDIRLHFINMPDQVARERLELLDYFDDDEAGRLDDRFEWISKGRMSTRIIDRMATRTPHLYDYEHTRRNKKWALRIENFLAYGGTYFVPIGMQHVLGPESLLKCLKDRRIEPRLVA